MHKPIKHKRQFKKAKKVVNKALKTAWSAVEDAQENSDPVESAAITCEILASADLSEQFNNYLDKLGSDMIGRVKEYLVWAKSGIVDGDKEELAKQIPFINLDDTAKAIDETLIAISDYLDKQ